MKFILLISIALGISGCEFNAPTSQYKAFVAKFGNSSRFYCDKNTGFLMKEYFYQSTNSVPSLRLVENDLEQPIRCGVPQINVLETSLGTNRMF